MSDINVNTTAVTKVTRLVTPLSGNLKPLSANVKPDTIIDTKSTGKAEKTASVKKIASVKKTASVKKAPKDQLTEAVTKLNDFIQKTQRDLRFRVDERSGRVVVSVIDRQNHEVIRQIPDEEALKMARRLHQGESLTLFNIKV